MNPSFAFPRPFVLCFLLALTALTGCGVSVYRPAEAAGFDLDPGYEIEDADVERAFLAKPQLPAELSVAYFSFAPEREEALGSVIDGSPRVKSSYRIPSLLVTGQRRFDGPASNGMSPYAAAPTRAPSIKKLRLLAARAKSDVLVIFDYGNRHTESANAWAATGVLILPLFFAPMADHRVESYLDAYVIDVRNGYLYAHVSASFEDEDDLRLLFDNPADELREAQWSELEESMGDKLAQVFADPRHALAARDAEVIATEPAPR